MMLQFLLIMPLIKWVCSFVGHNYQRLFWAVIIIGAIYFSWLLFYDHFVLNGTLPTFGQDKCFFPLTKLQT